MCEKYTRLVAALKALTQGDKPEEVVTLPMAEDEYNTRPDTVSYGMVSRDFESDALNAEDEKQDRSFEGSVHLFSLERSGAGWIPLIEKTLKDYCGPCWKLNSRQYERTTSQFHWEWTFEVI